MRAFVGFWPGASMRPSPLTVLLPLLLASLLGACSTTGPCGGDQAYLQAVDRPPLRLPSEITPSERLSPLVIPPVAPDAARLNPEPRCLEEPPSFFARPGAAADSSEDAVRAWARAWSEGQVDAVMGMYADNFAAPDGGGSAAYLEQRERQVSSGRAPSANIEDVTVTAAGADRRVVTFVQRFGQDGVRRELTLVREGNAWRIVSERTLEVL
jgi:hypothetical protein